MKKVALYTGAYPNTTFITLLARSLASHNIEVHIYGRLLMKTKEDGKLKFFTFSNKNLVYNLMFLLRYVVLNVFSDYKTTKKFFKLIRGQSNYNQFKQSLIILPMLYHKPDIIHVQWLKAYGFFKPFKSILSSKIILSLRGVQLSVSSFLYPKYRELTIEATNHAAIIHSISDDLTNKLMEINPDVKNKILKINPAIDLNFFTLPSAKLNRGKNKPLKIISVCRLYWIKGLEYAIIALKEVIDDGIDFEYTIVGSGDMKEELQFLIYDLNLDSNIKMVGDLSPKEVREYLKTSDVFLLPSVEEGFSNAVIEAQALGLPCLVSDTEGLKENIEHGKTGFVFKRRNSTEIAEYIKRFVDMERVEYASMKHNAVRRAKEHFDVKNQITEFIRMYESV
ncbi:glycosyltransferase family 4 protein [Aequorivita sp. H23M31]|uniref:Glycosyltransferase family 4 protein n=1 Tax=Aequorivita ciconiae TaxID=2494375 RepID=A0A410G273_9FLAO|nr:glycosyltransferase family 4 protein [Aequorivita sp. H23M31]QAA81366.1 glycosyltransferase family 4 protein [Aequorivita sp. H23M31]